jgi:glucose-1-phosphate adenylyltransferase
VGFGEDETPNRAEPERLNAGITIVGKRARIPRGVEIGRNCRIDPGVIERDFGGATRVASGETVYAASAAS